MEIGRSFIRFARSPTLRALILYAERHCSFDERNAVSVNNSSDLLNQSLSSQIIPRKEPSDKYPQMRVFTAFIRAVKVEHHSQTKFRVYPLPENRDLIKSA
jgi:hypothetical protein